MVLLRKGAADSKSSSHRTNSRRSTKLEIIGVDDHMHGVLWTLNFLVGHVFMLNNDIVYQDNQRAILMKKNGKYPR